jgi:hypothetical protein
MPLSRVCNLKIVNAQVVKLVDTLASGASGLMAVEVQVLSWAPLSNLTRSHKVRKTL